MTSESEIDPPAIKSRKVCMANHATIARTTKKDTKNKRASYARQSRHDNNGNNRLQNARQAKQKKQIKQQNIKNAREVGKNEYRNSNRSKCYCSSNNLTHLLSQINEKFKQYSELEQINAQIMYVNAFY